ncbi:MAG: DUF2974 domain-containing protein [Anaerolineaceae bacterium]|nr:DUF2974 domain-containing protein [Anaerolineaceae bacterium]MBN2676910.1 DUF2974 domain-containing protein [Anaerolineaceae bacterium]
MGTVMDYLKWRADLRFSQEPFNDVDALILAMLSYLDFKGIVPGVDEKEKISLEETARRYFLEHPSHKDDPESIDLTVSSSFDRGLMQMLKMTSKSARYSEIRLSRFVEKTDFPTEQQFAAITFSLPHTKRHKVIAFRGTDSTLIGWKENFELAYMKEVPAQESSSIYLNREISILSGKVTVCGHSKGGNLAVYAASRLKGIDQSHLSRIINFDGPGFNFSILPRSSFSDCARKVVNYVPEESIVGVLLDTVGERNVITSSARYLFQHNPLTWGIERSGFLGGELSVTTKLLEETVETWLAQLTLERRKAFIDALFDMLGASEGKTIDPKEGLKDISKVIKNVSDLDEDTRKMLSEVLASITDQARDTISNAIKEKLSLD